MVTVITAHVNKTASPVTRLKITGKVGLSIANGILAHPMLLLVTIIVTADVKRERHRADIDTVGAWKAQPLTVIDAVAAAVSMLLKLTDRS